MEPHAAGGGVHDGHPRHDDVQQGLGGGHDAELGLGADESRADVQKAAGALARQPLRAVDGHQGHHELLELGGRERRQADAQGGRDHAPRVAVGPEQAQLAVVAAVRLQALEALGGVVQHGRRRHQRERAERPQLGRRPPRLGRPRHRHHVVRRHRRAVNAVHLRRGDVPRRRRERVRQLRGVELLHVGGLRRAVGRAVGGAVGRSAILDQSVLDGGGGQVGILLAVVSVFRNGGGRHDDVMIISLFWFKSTLENFVSRE